MPSPVFGITSTHIDSSAELEEKWRIEKIRRVGAIF